MIKRICAVSGQEFEITASDLDFYRKMEIISMEDYEKLKSREISDCVGLPTLCPEERQRRRAAQRNQRYFYKRKCDFSGENMISLYDENYPGKVFHPKAYFSDHWDAKNYGRDFDFSRSFFDQFKELFLELPKLSLIHIGNNSIDNSEFTNDLYRVKNCYLVSDGEQSRDSMYGETFLKLDECLDFLFLEDSNFCYECVNCQNGYELFFSVNCQNCHQSWFLQDCRSCTNCFGCRNLINKKYCIYNKQYTQNEYNEFLNGFNSGDYKVIEKLKEASEKFWHSQFTKYYHGRRIENCVGDYITQSKDSHECYDCNELRDCKYCGHLLMGAKDCQDYNVWGDNAELIYECVCCGSNIHNITFSYYCSNNAKEVFYSMYCWFSVQDLFGCVGLTKSQYCILNKQYTKEEYFKIREKIIQHMKKTGEWGEFFPISLSPFAYNETVAQEYFPLTKEEATEKGYRWKDKISRDFRPATIEKIPDDISDVEDSICKEILACENCQKNYQIQKPELRFYRKMNLPIPRKCPDCRHADRMKLRNPRKLWNRECADCQKDIQTTFAPDRPEKVLCEKCYLKVVD